MKCTYRFPVDCQLRPDIVFPIRHSGYVWEFALKEGVVTELKVTVPLSSRDHWPKITKNVAPGVSAHVDPNLVHLGFLQFELRAIQGLLSLFGVKALQYSEVNVEWHPDSEDEQKALVLRTFTYKETRGRFDPKHRIPFDLLARAIIGSNIERDLEVSLSFFRRARLAYLEHEYIQAFYEYFFIVETLYGNGIFKQEPLCSELESSALLCEAISTVLKEGPSITPNEPQLRRDYQKRFANIGVKGYIRSIVKIRGFLHHHTSERVGIWNPELQDRYELDALVLGDICMRLLFQIAWPALNDPRVVSEYETQLREQSGGA